MGTSGQGGPLPSNLSGGGRLWAHERLFAAARYRRTNSVDRHKRTNASWTPEPQRKLRGGPEFESAHSSRTDRGGAEPCFSKTLQWTAGMRKKRPLREGLANGSYPSLCCRSQPTMSSGAKCNPRRH